MGRRCRCYGESGDSQMMGCDPKVGQDNKFGRSIIPVVSNAAGAISAHLVSLKLMLKLTLQ